MTLVIGIVIGYWVRPLGDILFKLVKKAHRAAKRE